MADNDSTIADPCDNDFEDWIKLYNAAGLAVDLGGMYLTDNLSNPVMYPIPANVIIDAGEYLLFWADNESGQGDTHTNFSLSKNNGIDDVGLFDTDGTTEIDSIADFPAQTGDDSYGLYPDAVDWGRVFVLDRRMVLCYCPGR